MEDLVTWKATEEADGTTTLCPLKAGIMNSYFQLGQRVGAVVGTVTSQEEGFRFESAVPVWASVHSPKT